jgi:hypothetical protein
MIMKFTSLSGWLAAGCLVLSANAAANEVIVTPGQGGNRIALDFMHTGEATAFEFEIRMPKGVKNVNTSKCVSEVPATHTGACQFNEKTGNLVVIVYSNQNDLLPEGVISLGFVDAPGVASARAQPAVSKLLVGDVNGNPLSVSNSAQSGSTNAATQAKEEIR